MTRAVHIDGGDFVVDADELARGFGLDATEVLRKLQEGALTSRCEKGIDEHAGRHRLVFTHEKRILRLTVDADGAILSRMMYAPPPPVRHCENTGPWTKDAG